MEIQLQQQTINGEFFIEDEQKIKLAYLTFIMDNATEMRINHTVVSEVLRGKESLENWWIMRAICQR